jgi:hypothetical protein
MFRTAEKILLQPNDTNLTYSFQFPICTSATANDGFLPAGTTISGVAVYGYTEAGVDCTTTLCSGVITNNTNTVFVPLSYPGAEGYYKLTFILTLSDGATTEDDFNNIEAVNK